MCLYPFLRLLSMALWYDDIYDNKARYGLRVTRSLFHGRSELQTIDIFETALFGKTLTLDGVYMTSVADEFYYHEMLVNPALTTAPHIGNVLVIGGGDGGTVREILSYPEVKRATMVEIDGMVIEACQKYLPEIGRAWADPRLQVLVRDGISFVAEYKGEPFDVILIDGPDPIGQAAGLYASGFLSNCKKLLSPNGVLATQSESPHTMPNDFSRIVRTLQEVFPRVYPYFAPVPVYSHGGWSYTYASATVDPLVIDEERGLRAEKRCSFYNREVHRGAFAVPNNIKKLLRTNG